MKFARVENLRHFLTFLGLTKVQGNVTKHRQTFQPLTYTLTRHNIPCTGKIVTPIVDSPVGGPRDNEARAPSQEAEEDNRRLNRTRFTVGRQERGRGKEKIGREGRERGRGRDSDGDLLSCIPLGATCPTWGTACVYASCRKPRDFLLVDGLEDHLASR